MAQLTAKQEKVLAALLSEPSIEAAAKSIGLDKTSIYRYLKEPAFIEAYRGARREIVSHAVSRLQQACSVAVQTLESVATDPTAAAAARVSAARTILDFSLRAVEIEDLAARVEALEALQSPPGNVADRW